MSEQDSAATQAILADIHDPREHYRKLLVDAFPALTLHLHAIFNASRSEDMMKIATANQALGVWIGQQMSEANKLGVAEGRQERDISELVFRGALELLRPGHMDHVIGMRAHSRENAIAEARLLWDETRLHVLKSEADARAKHEAAAEALVRDFAQTLDGFNSSPTKP